MGVYENLRIFFTLQCMYARCKSSETCAESSMYVRMYVCVCVDVCENIEHTILVQNHRNFSQFTVMCACACPRILRNLCSSLLVW